MKKRKKKKKSIEVKKEVEKSKYGYKTYPQFYFSVVHLLWRPKEIIEIISQNIYKYDEYWDGEEPVEPVEAIAW